MKRILITGDSMSYGHNCSDRIHYHDPVTGKEIGDHNLLSLPPSDYCWGSLLKKDMLIDVVNLSRPGSSNQGSMIRLLKEINEPCDLVIFVGTWNNRFEVAHDKKDCTSSIISNNNKFIFDDKWYNDSIRAYIKYLYHDDVIDSGSIMPIITMHRYCEFYNIKFMWSFPENESTFHDMDKIINDSRIPSIQNVISTVINQTKDDYKKYQMPDRHFNNLGHETYYDKFIKDRVTHL